MLDIIGRSKVVATSTSLDEVHELLKSVPLMSFLFVERRVRSDNHLHRCEFANEVCRVQETPIVSSEGVTEEELVEVDDPLSDRWQRVARFEAAGGATSGYEV